MTLAALMVVAALAAAEQPVADTPAPVAQAASVPAAEAPTRTLRTGGRTFGYRSVGEGRPIVLIMGLSGTIDGWDPTFVDALVRQGRRVIMFDNAGIGRTSSQPGTLTIRRMSEDAYRVIRALKLRRPDVLGWSMGGMIAQSLAVRHPRAIRRLVLAATAPGDGKATNPAPEALALLAGNGAAAGDVLFPPGHEAARRRFAANIVKRKNPNTRAPADVIRSQAVAAGGWMSGGDRDGRRIRTLKMPVLVGGGALDAMLPVANQRHLARTIPRAELVVYQDAAHGFFLQRRSDFLPRLRRFLR